MFSSKKQPAIRSLIGEGTEQVAHGNRPGDALQLRHIGLQGVEERLVEDFFACQRALLR